MPGDNRFIEIQQRPRWSWPWRWWQFALVGIFACCIAGATTVAGVIWYFAKDVPSLESLQNYQPSLVTTVYSDDRQPIAQFFIERRILTPLALIPKSLTQAVIATEDARFFEHPGLDYVGMLRAAWTNIRHGGKKVEGASTITQQLARSLFLSSERSYERKIRELLLAYKMEAAAGKEQILETYLNQIYFGQGAYGVGAQGIRDYWTRVTSGQRDVKFQYQVLSVKGSTGIAHWHAEFAVADSTPATTIALDGVFLLEFDGGGKCRSLREWWHLKSTAAP